MIHFDRVPEPEDFDGECRQPGQQWLVENPAPARPRDYWTPFKPQLGAGFGQLCGYSAMFEPVGTVDHYMSCNTHRGIAYDWDNYRYSAGWINSSKGTADDAVLDPFEVGDDWFEIILPSLQLRGTDNIPLHYREKAEFTLDRLHLRNDERVMRQRRRWMEMYEQKKLTLDGLREVAPLLAKAIERRRTP